MNKGIIYAIVNKKTEEYKYIGCTTRFDKRKKEHFTLRLDRPHKIQPIQQYIFDNGPENFEMIALEEVEFRTIDELYEREIFYINKYQTSETGLNRYEGGKKVGKSDRNPNVRKVRCLNTGEVFVSVGAVCGRFGLKMTELSSHLSGKRYKNGIGKRKFGEALLFEYADKKPKEHTLSPEAKKRISEAAVKNNNKSILNENTGEIYKNLKEASEKLEINYSNLSSIINGKLKIKKFENIKLKYIEKV